MREELYQGVFGTQIRPDNSRAGVVDDGSVAWEERIFEARRQWPEATPDDFEKVGKRLWRDRATGIEYRQAHGAPLQAIGTDATRFVSCFLVLDGKLIFLRRNDVPEGTFVHHGEVVGRQLPVQVVPVVIH
jgi:hypothetical protein